MFRLAEEHPWLFAALITVMLIVVVTIAGFLTTWLLTFGVIGIIIIVVIAIIAFFLALGLGIRHG